MHTIDDVKMIKFSDFGDERGKLVVIEGEKDIPFQIKRVFYIYDSDHDIIRGQHANKESQFVLVNVSGQSKVKVYDGKSSKIITLDQPMMGVYLPSMIWKDMYDFSSNAVLLVIASEYYDEEEYIRDINDYEAMVKEESF